MGEAGGRRFDMGGAWVATEEPLGLRGRLKMSSTACRQG